MYRLLTVLAAAAVIALPSSAQTFQRRATIVGGGGGDRGKCTIEVVVDGAAEVSIRGDQGTIRNLSGNPASWRRFECSSPMPANAGDFRFQGVDGRGRQELIRDPRNGGTAVIRIEDPNGGSEGYTFDVMWGGYQNPGRGPITDNRGPERPPVTMPPPDRGDYRGADRMPDNRGPNRWTTEQAIEGCRDAIRIQARDRFRGRRVEFLSTRIDDNPGRNDYVMGAVEVFRGRLMENRYRFSCAVNFDSGRVRSADIEPRPAGRDFRGESDRVGGGMNGGANRALQTCQAAVENRLSRDGFNRTEFQALRMDDAPGRNDWVVGNVRAFGPRGSDAFNFACSVNLRDGDVRSVDVTRR